MKEFMLRILNKADHQRDWSETMHLQFIKKCEIYIKELKKNKNLISAQPLVREGVILSSKAGGWKEQSLNKTGEVQFGYYHILAKDLKDAISIAKKNPEFAFSKTARIEVRPIKTKEKDTGFIYPKHSR